IAEAVVDSFNATTVDGDTSTSDTLMLFATGKAAARGQTPVTDASDARLEAFRAALKSLTLELAQYVARDGEGARKFVEVHVTGAVS
ncbi:bifunctional ornithine acetyltransferase/N-acetylglutamate synthase, partial [Acinetobacter baumannii]